MLPVMSAPHRSFQTRFLARLPAVLLLGVAVLGTILLRDNLTFEALARHRAALTAFRDAHYLACLGLFWLSYVAIVAFSLPGATLATLTGGFLFGLFPGVIFNHLAATTGAVLLFLAVRMGFGKSLAQRIAAMGGRPARLRAALARNEWEILFLMRVTPIVPFFVANLLPALLNVPLHRFVLTTALGILPGALVLTSVGAGLGAVFETGGRPDLGILLAPHVIGPILGLVVLGVLPILVRAWRGKGL